MTWTPVSFGKYKGKTLPQILFVDPDWFFWAVQKGAFKGKHPSGEVKDIQHKACHIKVPASAPANSVIEYTIDRSTGKLADVDVISAERSPHQGSSPTNRRNYFDLSFPRQMAKYDKLGGRIIVKAIKYHHFGKDDARMTAKRCVEFFDNPAHFG